MDATFSVSGDTAFADVLARRRHTRERIICSGYLEVAGLRPVLCMVRDLSEGGARLRVPSGFDLAGGVTLHVPDLKWRRPAKIVWDHGHSVGVQFVGPASAT